MQTFKAYLKIKKKSQIFKLLCFIGAALAQLEIESTKLLFVDSDATAM